MRKNSNNEIILTETEFLEIVGNDIDNLKEFIEIWGEDITLGELLETLIEREEVENGLS